MLTSIPSRDLTRAERAFVDVLPLTIRQRVLRELEGNALIVGGQRLNLGWAGEGHLGDVRRVLSSTERPDIVAGRRLSPGARATLAEAGLSWVDETGAAEVAIGTLIIARTGRDLPIVARPARWAPATLAVAESLLCGVSATVSATRAATGMSSGSCTSALRTLADLGLLKAAAARGRDAGRRVDEPTALLSAYAEAADALRSPTQLQVGVTWRDFVVGLADAGRRWDSAAVQWCVTAGVAASILAPHLSSVAHGEVYVSAQSLSGLEAVAAQAGLRPIDGGRLTLRPFPSEGVRRLASHNAGLRLAPWPRVFADVRLTGVRGEEAAEHLREVMSDRRA